MTFYNFLSFFDLNERRIEHWGRCGSIQALTLAANHRVPSPQTPISACTLHRTRIWCQCQAWISRIPIWMHRILQIFLVSPFTVSFFPATFFSCGEEGCILGHSYFKPWSKFTEQFRKRTIILCGPWQGRRSLRLRKRFLEQCVRRWRLLFDPGRLPSRSLWPWAGGSNEVGTRRDGGAVFERSKAIHTLFFKTVLGIWFNKD